MTRGLEGRRSVQLSYGRMRHWQALDRQPPKVHQTGLLSSPCQGPERQVGAAGFEPATPRSQSECATGLRHAPNSER